LENLIFSYNNKGQRTEQILTDSFQRTKTTFQYDRKGNLTEMAAMSHTGKPLYLVTLIYEKNQVVGEQVIVYDWGTMNETTFKNDKQGREIEAVTSFFNSAGILIAQETRTTVYEDDEYGNWIMKKTFVDGMPEKLFKRTIEYYFQ
jgi:hypothetical protein